MSTRRFPNLERLAVQLLLRDVPELADTEITPTTYRPDGIVYHVSTDDDVPDDLASILPYVRVTSRPAGQRDLVTDRAFLDIDVWDSIEFGDAEALAERLADPMRSPIRTRAAAMGAGWFDYVGHSRPSSVRWADSNVSRYLLQMQVSARRTGG